MRVFNLVLLSAMVAGAVATYNLKHQAELAAERVRSLTAEIAKEKDEIATLTAELSYLSQPARLQTVIEKYDDYFALRPFRPDQIASIDEIPLKASAAKPANTVASARTNDPVAAALARIAAGGTLRGIR